MESDVVVKYWIGGTTGETGFHSILCAPFNPGGGSRKEILEFDNRPPDTGSTVYSELANQPTRKALSTYVVYSKNRHKVGRWSRIMKHEEKI